MINSRAAAMPMPASKPAAKWLFDMVELEGEVVGEVAGKIVGETVGKPGAKRGVEDTEELEVVVVAPVNSEKLEAVTAAVEEEFGRIVDEVIAAREKMRDEVAQQFARVQP